MEIKILFNQKPYELVALCTAKICAAADLSNSLKLIIPVPPSWKDMPTNQEVTLGQRVELPCAADGAPLPKITWKKEIGMSKY